MATSESWDPEERFKTQFSKNCNRSALEFNTCFHPNSLESREICEHNLHTGQLLLNSRPFESNKGKLRHMRFRDSHKLKSLIRCSKQINPVLAGAFPCIEQVFHPDVEIPEDVSRLRRPYHAGKQECAVENQGYA